jgi:hypothetical protein
MTLTKDTYYILFLAVISFLLLVLIFYWIDYLSINKYIIENFQQLDNLSLNNSTSHTVDLPLTTTYSCKNFCGPQARCAITGQQCTADIDCPGCQPKISGIKTQSSNRNVPGNNDAGKLTVGVTPQYSPLTSDIGTKALRISGKEFSKTPSPTFGINTWRDDFDTEQKLFDKRYKPPSDLEFMPSYPPRYSVTGDFLENGPLASNATLN